MFVVQDFVVVQSLSGVQLFTIPWTAACQTSLSICKSWSLLKLMSIELVMPSNQLIVPIKLTTTIEEGKKGEKEKVKKKKKKENNL